MKTKSLLVPFHVLPNKFLDPQTIEPLNGHFSFHCTSPNLTSLHLVALPYGLAIMKNASRVFFFFFWDKSYFQKPTLTLY
jgi:hypothetical protein